MISLTRPSMAAPSTVVPSLAGDLSHVPSSRSDPPLRGTARQHGPMTASATPTSSTPTSASVHLVGRLGARVETRDLPSGDTITVFTIVVDRPRGRPGSASAVRIDAIACQSARADVVRRLDRLAPGDLVQAEGTLRRRFWRSPAGLGSAMEVEVSRLRTAG